MTDSSPAEHDGWVEYNAQDSDSDGSMFATTFGSITGRLHKAVSMAKTSLSTSEKLPSDPLHANKCRKTDNDEPSETESTTTESSDRGLPATAEEVSILEAKVQILYGQLHNKEATIKQLKEEEKHTRQDFEIFEKESAECMEELGIYIDDLKGQQKERDDRIKELESLQIIPEHTDGDYEEAFHAELEKLRYQLRTKDAQLKSMEQKLKEKDDMIIKLEESENLNFSLVEERNEEIKRLNAKISGMCKGIPSSELLSSRQDPEKASSLESKQTEKHKVMIDSLTKELEKKGLQALALGAAQLMAEIQAVNSESQIENRRHEHEWDQEELIRQIQEQTQPRIEELENESTLSGDLVKELEKLQVHGEPRNEGDEALLATKLELETRLGESELQRREVQEEIYVFSSQKDSAKQLDDVKAALITETLRCESLWATIEKLKGEAEERDRKITALGFSTDAELIDALHETQQHLKIKEGELRKFSLREKGSNKGLFSGIGDCNFLAKVGMMSGIHSRDTNKDDPKSIENLLREEKGLCEELKTRVKALTRDLKNKETDDESTASTDIHTFYMHISKQIVALVANLSARDGISSDLIKAFQLKLEYTSSLERQLDARETQIEMLVLELEELEQNRDNLGTSTNSDGSSHTLLVSSNLEELLTDIHERDEKLKVLEWLTVDLSKTLEKQTDEFEEYKEKAEKQESKKQKKIELLLNEVHDRDVEIQCLKKVLEAEEGTARKCAEVEARLSKECLRRDALEAMVDSLKDHLHVSENKVKTLEIQRERGEDQEETNREEPQRMVNSLTIDLRGTENKVRALEMQLEDQKQEGSRREELQTMVDSLTKKLCETEDNFDALERQVEASRHERTKREGLQAMVDSLTEDLHNAKGKIKILEKQIETRRQGETQREGLQTIIDSLTEDLHVAKNTVRTLETQMKAHRYKETQREGLQELVTSLAQDQQQSDGEVERLKAQVEYTKEELSSQRDELQAKINCLTKDLNDASKRIASLETEIESKKSFIWMRERQLEQVSSLELSLNKEKKQRQDLGAKVDALSTAVLERERIIEKMVLEKEETEARVTGFRGDLEERYHEVETLVCVLGRQEQCIREMENEKESNHGELRDVEHEVLTLLQDLQLKEQRIVELELAQQVSADRKEKLEKDSVRASNATFQVEQANQENLVLTENLKEQFQKASKAELEDLSKEKSILCRQNEDLKAKLEERKTVQSELESSLADHSKDKIILCKQLTELRAERAALLDDLKSREERLQETSKCAAQIEELKALNANHLAGLKAWEGRVNELERLVAAKDEVFQEMTLVEKLLCEQKSRSQDLLNQVDGLTLSLEEKEKELALVKADNEKHEGDIKVLRHEHAQDRSQYEAEYEAAQTKRVQLEKELEEETKLLTAKIRDYNELERRLKEAEEERDRLGGQIESLRKACFDTAGLESRLKSLQEECTTKQGRIQELMRRCQDYSQLKRDYEAITRDGNKKEDTINKLTQMFQDYSKLERQFEAQTQECNRQQGTIDVLTQKLQNYSKLERECEAKQQAIDQLTQRCHDYLDLERRCEAKTQECNIFAEEMKSLAQDLQRIKDEADINESAIKSSIEEKDKELNSLQTVNAERECVIKELRAKCQNLSWLECEISEMTQNLESTRVALAGAQVSVKRYSSTEALLRKEIQNLRREVNELYSQVDKVSEEKAALVDEFAEMHTRTIDEEGKLAQVHQDRMVQISESMESLTEVLEERAKQVEALQEDNKLKVALVQKLQQKLDGQSNDIKRLMEEHESECAELHEKLECITGELQATNLRLMETELEERDKVNEIQKLERDLNFVRKENESIQMENYKVRGQLEAIGFESMEELERGLADKSREHDEMEKLIQESNQKISFLQKDLEIEKERQGPDFDSLKHENVSQIHKIRELEMKIGIFREEIAGKNAIVEDLTLRLNCHLTEGHFTDTGTDRLSIHTRDAPGLRMKRVTSPTINLAPKKAPLAVDSACKTAKALATIPELIKTIKERDETIKILQEEISASKRAIESLVKGLEYNVQEKIEADRLFHEKNTQCTKFASKVQHLLLKLEELEDHSKRPTNQKLARMDEIKSLSVSELVDLLRQSRLLAEDLSDERERLIANATNMSIALAESQSRAEESMHELDPDAIDEDS